MSTDFVVFCKTYRADLRRTQRLLLSLAQHNPERIPVVVSVPAADHKLFAEQLPEGLCTLVHDEDIVAAHPEAATRQLQQRYEATPGYLSQQVVKSEAWRLLGCDAYLCADADTVLLRDMRRADFVAADGTPYTQVHQAKELHQLALARGHPEVLEYFRRDNATMKAIFGRTGPDYDYGPLPLVWSARVWRSLQVNHLWPRGITLWDAIEQAPIETRWYGESLLAWRAIELRPIEPLFKVYHYEWQHAAAERQGERTEQLPAQYLGAVYQSNWQFELDEAGQRSALSVLARRFQRWRRR